MIIKSYLEKNPRRKFLVKSNSDNVSIKKILKVLDVNSLGFCVIKIKQKYKILTDGDFRRAILKDNFFISASSKRIKFKKLFVVDINDTMYSAYRLMNNKQINCVLVTKKKEVISYLTLHEINETLSPERLNLDKKNLKKFKTDIGKHLTRYNFANLFIKNNAEVLDAACGVGYGTSVLSQKAKSIIGIDYSKAAIKFATQNYKNKKIKFIETNILKYKPNKKFDAVVSLETLEHINRVDGINWIKKSYNMLKKNGIFVCSSPLLRIRNGKPFITNPHHLHEMKKSELVKILKSTFNTKNINIFIQDSNSLKPILNENEGLSIFVVRKK